MAVNKYIRCTCYLRVTDWQNHYITERKKHDNYVKCMYVIQPLNRCLCHWLILQWIDTGWQEGHPACNKL